MQPRQAKEEQTLKVIRNMLQRFDVHPNQSPPPQIQFYKANTVTISEVRLPAISQQKSLPLSGDASLIKQLSTNRIHLDLVENSQQFFTNSRFNSLSKDIENKSFEDSKMDQSFHRYHRLIYQSKRQVLSARYDEKSVETSVNKLSVINRESKLGQRTLSKPIRIINKPKETEDVYQFKQLKEEQQRLIKNVHLSRFNKVKLQKQLEGITTYLQEVNQKQTKNIYFN